MQELFKNHIDQNLSFLNGSRLLIAISGGLDSVVLTHLCHELELNIALAHCNFRLRGNESDADENFVMELAKELNIEAFVEQFDTKKIAATEKESIQMIARELRYNWFYDLAEDLNFDFILTAHHADDNLETFLINLTRGSGIRGLSGIPEINDVVVRPLLPFSRTQLEIYANKKDLSWREDSSNSSDAYLRNKLRHHIIPKLKEISPELISNFNTSMSNLKDTSDIVDESLNAVAKRAISEIDEHQIKFKVSEFEKVNNSKAYLFEMFNAYGFTEWNDVLGLLKAQSGKQVLSKTHRLIKDRSHLILTDLDETQLSQHNTEEVILVHETDKTVNLPIGELHFDEDHVLSQAPSLKVVVDQAKLKFPLEIRKWQKGDVFYPQGMKGKKKLSKYFKDEKLSIVDKEKIWLLTSEAKVVWIIGMRADERYKVTEQTNKTLRITLKE